MIDPSLQAQAKLELERRLSCERGRYYLPNGGLRRVLAKIKAEIPVADRRIHVVIVRAGNGVGKTAFVCNIASYLMNQYSNKYFDEVPQLKEYRRPNRGRILTTATAAQGVYDEEMAKWMPGKRYARNKAGHKFYQHYKSLVTGSELDILTFDQDSEQGESVTLDYGIIDEPCPFEHYKALRARFRFGGIIFLVMTPLRGAGWVKHVLEDPDRTGPGGDVHIVQLSSEENCREHGVDGILPHASIESQLVDFDEADVAARRDGGYLEDSGIVFPTYRDENWTDQDGKIVGHVMPELEGYHLRCFDEGLFSIYNICDPHDRKPFALAWNLVFPNEDCITVAEWPDDSLRLFHKIKSCSWDPPTYARMIKATEQALFKRPADVRIIDPNFGNAIKATSKTTVKEDFRAAGRKLDWRLEFEDALCDDHTQGHIALRSLVGDPARGVRPKLFVLAHCKNTRFGFKNYGYKENRDHSRGLSEKPELVFKDFPDLHRYFAIQAPRYVKRLAKDSEEFQAAESKRREKYKPRRVAGYVGMHG